MNAPAPPQTTELLIAALTPPLLERGAFWFAENLDSIKKARQTNLWWRNNTLIVERDLVIKPSELSLRLLDLGYERTPRVIGPGLFALRGGVAEIWPINKEKSQLIEFAGNVIANIYELPEKEKINPALDRNALNHTADAGYLHGTTQQKQKTFKGGVKLSPQSKLNSLDKIQPGCFLVHADHGIGIFRGYAAKNEFSISNFQFSNDLQTFNQKTDDIFLIIEYAPPRRGGEPDKLLVPVEEENRISPYIGFTTPAIHRLGGAIWQNTKRKTREDAEKLARELLELYAKRSKTGRQPHQGDPALEAELKNTFSFSETAGQERAEENIMADLSKSYPMDRILCGDVGFGKTEVAIRAALRVITSGKQIALLTPTTVLAAQHEKTFQERLKSLPVTAKMISRLTGSKDQRQTLKDLAHGKIDCLIGTHRLLSKDIKFKDLGLLIIDEEQRFGVKQKEHFKGLRTQIDILSLSATPIPRTLSLALTKMHDISLIDTPPPERIPIKTLILPYSSQTIKSALEFELGRNGQVYFLHNRIETLAAVKNKIEKLTAKIPGPQPQIGILHGRLPEKEIIKTMDKFRNKEINILLTTTIIENGLDISSANTLIVDNATNLGLAETHQLRGRVGRGKEQAFAYFLYRPRRLTEKAAQRLEALKEYAGLGEGYQIALRDLEIRGAGNILGREQSGAINKVGLNLYCQILNEVVEEIKK